MARGMRIFNSSSWRGRPIALVWGLPWSVVLFVISVTMGSPKVVAADSSLVATTVTSSSVSLSWPTITGASGYKIYLAPEPSGLETAAGRKIVASLPSSATAFQVAGLAARVDVFLKIEAVGVNESYLVYAKTLGGQGALLDPILTNGAASTSLKSVSLYAPNILLLVFEDKRVESFSSRDDWLDKGNDFVGKYTGGTWQAGPWAISRNDGSSLNVVATYRDSIPVGNLYDRLVDDGNQVGGAQNNHLMDVEHHVYLKLDGNVGQRDILTVSGPSGLTFTLPYSDMYLETPVIQLNQVGYNPRATRRYAYVSGWLGDGGPLALNNFPAQARVLVESNAPFSVRSEVVNGIPVSLRSALDTNAGTEVREMDLSSVPANNQAFYRVHLPGVGVSYRTMVSELATLKAYYVTTRGLFLNRWGRDLDCAYTDWCDRNPDHPTVFTAEKPTQGFFPNDTPKTGERPLVGGHHDAGDFDIRVFHYVVARQMMRAYELNRQAFTDNQLNIPESGNGIPDFLDEILWNLAAWEQLQEADGGVRPGVESYRHPLGNYFADADNLPYWTYARDAVHSLRIAGLFAQASRLVAPFSATKANDLKLEAIGAYNYAVGSGNYDSIGGPIFYALSELYRVTGNEAYKSKFEQLWEANKAGSSGIPSIRHLENWTTAYSLPSGQPILGDHILGYLTSNSTDATSESFRTAADTNFATAASNEIQRMDSRDAHRNGKPVTLPSDWGKSVGQNEYVMGIYSKLQLGTATSEQRQEYLNTMSLAVDYVLGGNPLGMCWVTGLGSRSPQNPLHNDSIAFQILKGLPPMPGIPVYGPAGLTSAASYYDYGRNVMYPDPANRPALRTYGDLRSFVAANEFTVTETQSNVTSLFASLVGTNLTIPPSWKPGQADHKDRLPLDESVSAASKLVAPTIDTPGPSGGINQIITFTSSRIRPGKKSPFTLTFTEALEADARGCFKAKFSSKKSGRSVRVTLRGNRVVFDLVSKVRGKRVRVAWPTVGKLTVRISANCAKGVSGSFVDTDADGTAGGGARQLTMRLAKKST